MGTETVKKFYEVLKNDKAMADELRKSADAVEQRTPESVAAFLVKFAAAKGYAFTTEDLKTFEAETRELRADDLNKINAAGGPVKLEYCVGCPWL